MHQDPRHRDTETRRATLAALRATWTRRLLTEWNRANWAYAREQLVAPSIQVDDAKTRLGFYSEPLRVLSIGADHIANDPWDEVMETLRHEMAHQYVFEILKVSDERPHGPAFQRACELFRVDPSARQSCDDRDPGVRSADAGLLEKVVKLFALGQSSNENEAQAAMKKARALVARYGIDPTDDPTTRAFGRRQVGPSKQRRQAFEYQLASILQSFFHVQGIWVQTYDARADKAGTVLEICGTETHLQLAEYVHTYLWRLLPDLWIRYKREHGVRRDADRASYYSGVLRGFHRKLEDQAKSATREEALILTKRNPALEAHFRHLHPSVRSHGGSRTRWSEAFEQGKVDGQSISIRKPVGEGEGGRMLGDGT